MIYMIELINGAIAQGFLNIPAWSWDEGLRNTTCLFQLMNIIDIEIHKHNIKERQE